MIKTRSDRIISENESQNKILSALYGTIPGRMILKLLTLPIISRAVGAFMDSPISKPMIKKFIKKNNIDTSDYIMTGLKSFNDFFTRKIKDGARNPDLSPESLISPCDSKLSAYKICGRSVFRIKGSYYRVSDLLGSRKLAEKYKGGWCLIFRLCVDDYHRYCYIDSGTKSENVFIPGILHTVNPIALEHYNIYKRNCREYSLLNTEHFGCVAQVEVGAMMVGKICNYHQAYRFKKVEEKGKFMFGGSTIVLLIEKDRVVIDGDILANTAAGIETAVKYGERIAHRAPSRELRVKS